MKINTPEQADTLAALIGDQNAAATKRALADGAPVWVFRSEEEITSDPDLRSDEKEACLKIFRTEKLGWAGWYRAPAPKPVPGFTSSPGVNAHGDVRTTGSERSTKWSH